MALNPTSPLLCHVFPQVRDPTYARVAIPGSSYSYFHVKIPGVPLMSFRAGSVLDLWSRGRLHTLWYCHLSDTRPILDVHSSSLLYRLSSPHALDAYMTKHGTGTKKPGIDVNRESVVYTILQKVYSVTPYLVDSMLQELGDDWRWTVEGVIRDIGNVAV